MARARLGKIARLPHALREDVNRRLLDGQPSSQILPWLNSQPDAIATWERHFEGAPASPQNLSEWRLGGYKSWLARRERVDNLKTLQDHCIQLAKAGHSISEGVASALAGEMLGRLETLEDQDLDDLIDSLAKLRKGDDARARRDLDKQRLALLERDLALKEDKFRRQTVEQFLKWAKSDQAQAILNSGQSRQVQMTELHQLMFGQKPSDA